MSHLTSPIAQAYWATGPLRGELRPTRLADPGPDEALVRTMFTGISRGTEALVAAGRVPQSQWQRMRCPFQEGEFPFPVKYGYAAVGRVECGPAEMTGRAVFCLYPHQTAFVAPVANLVPIPDDVPPERAVLAANMQTALNALWDGPVLAGDRVIIIGAGVVGALIARLAGRVPGTDVTLVDRDPKRAGLAAALGAGFALLDAAPREADLVVEASGNPAALGNAFELAGFEATVLAVGWYGIDEVCLPLGHDFHSRRLRLVSSQVGAIATRQRPRWDHPRRAAKVMDLLADPALDMLFTGESRFAELPEVLPRLAAEPAGALCHRIRYD